MFPEQIGSTEGLQFLALCCCKSGADEMHYRLACKAVAAPPAVRYDHHPITSGDKASVNRLIIRRIATKNAVSEPHNPI